MHRGGRQNTSWGRHQRGGTVGGQGRSSSSHSSVEDGRTGHLICGHDLTTLTCSWRSNSEVALKLHRADRHLILPPGGIQELERIDPILEEERKEKARRIRKKGPDEAVEEQQSSLITGLNITLSTPELIQQWIAERKKRWPSQAVVEKKVRESWDTRPDYKGKGRALQQQKEQLSVVREKVPDKIVNSINPSSHSSDSSSSSSSSSSTSDEEVQEDDEDSGSDMDPEKDAISSKVAPPSAHLHAASSKLCRFFQQGRCSFGDKCRDRHEAPTSTTSHPQSSAPKNRKRPRMPSPNPFEAPHLLRALLKNEIAQHVNYVAQVIRFLVRNDYLEGFEEREGEAEVQARRRQLVVEEPMQGATEAENRIEDGRDEISFGKPLINGGLPTLGNTIIEPTSTTLKPLHSLALPPEPDPMAFMDPLRANDAKPLLHAQYREIAIDGGIRSLLLDDQGKASASMIRALSTLDALPSYGHRSSAIELILGVSEQSQLHPHQVGPTFVRSDRNPSSSRVIGESELFRSGLRVGPLEIGKIRQLAARISDVVGGPSFEVDNDVEGEDSMRPWWDKETRDEMRRKKYAKEADWRDHMKKLGLEID